MTLTSPSTAPGPVVLVTRARSRNQGNVTLSRVWRSMLGECFPGRKIVVLERIPSHLKQYGMASIAGAKDPIAAFDAIARKVAGLAAAGGDPDWNGDPIELTTGDPVTRPLGSLTALLNIRTRLAGFGAYRKPFTQRQAVVGAASMVVINAAGEFFDKVTDTPLQYLIDMRAAQLLGKPTAFVNTSFEVVDPLLLRVAAHVCDHADILEFRDTESADHYRRGGGTKTPTILPDAAIGTPRLDVPVEPVPGRIGFAMNGPFAESADIVTDWQQLLAGLKAEGLAPAVYSNEWYTDEPMWQGWVAQQGYPAFGKASDVPDYMRELGQAEVIVSSRLHTCVLAMLAGVPVVAVESGTFKLTGFYKQAGLPGAPISPTGDWTAQVRAAIADARANSAAVVAAQDAAIDAARAHLLGGVKALFAPFA